MERHTPVFLKEINTFLRPGKSEIVVDATLGTAGHAEKLVEHMSDGVFIGIDQDTDAIEYAKQVLEKNTSVKKHIVEGNFKNIDVILQRLGIQKVDCILADLGWGSHQIESGRGFSFQKDEPLQMCYSMKENGCALTADEIVNAFEEENLYTIIKHYGEERWAKRIAAFIVHARQEKKIETAKELAEIISKAIPRKLQSRHVHPATKTFQAIRMTVNEEVETLKTFLENIQKITHENTRISIITFHSIEDRIVKRTFQAWEKNKFGKRENKRAIKPSEEEVKQNQRSRSALLRNFTIY